MTAETDLLPCPFCGSADAPRLKNTHTASFWVSCSEEDGGCGAKTSGQFFPGPSRRTRFCYDPEAPEGSTFEARTLGELHPEYRRAAKSAIAAWNRRAQSAEVEALRAERDLFRDETITLVRQNGEWQAHAERLAEALRWYAEQAAGCRKLGRDGDAARAALDADGGGRARAALEQEAGRG